jgi:transcriptional regulator with XRE-family HTH domain
MIALGGTPMDTLRMDNPDFGDLLTALLRRRGLTLAELAPQVGVSASTLSRIRSGQRAPTETQARALAEALGLNGAEAEEFIARALLQTVPAAVRERLRAVEAQASAAQDRSRQLAQDYARYRSDTGFHDGWWLTYSRSFFNDGRIQRSLLRLQGGEARLLAGEHGILRYTYHGRCEALGDKLFIRVSEDRGAVEHVQITCHSLFDLSQPAFLYGLVCGISGTDVRHPVSWPAAARILLLHAGALDAPDRERQLTATLGGFEAGRLKGAWPSFLGEDDHLRTALQLGDEPTDAAVMRLTDNRLGGDHVLRAALG